VRGRNGEKIIFLDVDGESSKEVFLWTYFLSSTLLLNLTPGDRKAEDQFISRLETIRISLQFEPEELSLPQLIVVYRDNAGKDYANKEFEAKVEALGLFS
jgi:hypothetical protein